MPSSQAHSPFLNLPPELTELTLVFAVARGDVTSISAVAQTCHYMRSLVYGASDQHLWREVFLAAFDDPRLADRADKTDPYKAFHTNRADCNESDDLSREVAVVCEKSRDWGAEYRERVWSLKMVQRFLPRSATR